MFAVRLDESLDNSLRRACSLSDLTVQPRSPQVNNNNNNIQQGKFHYFGRCKKFGARSSCVCQNRKSFWAFNEIASFCQNFTAKLKSSQAPVLRQANARKSLATNIMRSGSIGVLNQTDSETEIGDRKFKRLLKPTISSQNKITSNTNKNTNIRKRYSQSACE